MGSNQLAITLQRLTRSWDRGLHGERGRRAVPGQYYLPLNDSRFRY